MNDPIKQGELLLGPQVIRKGRRRENDSNRANDLDGVRWTRNSISLWADIRKTPEEVALKHPAMFPAQLAAKLIQCFTTMDDRIVLDPFVGIGSTVLAAEALGKTGIGFDVSEEYVKKARGRPSLPRDMFESKDLETAPGTRQFHLADANDLPDHLEPESVDLVITPPPYWNILLQNRSADYKETRHYGEAHNDLGKIESYDAFLVALSSVFEKVLAVLEAGKYCCVIVMDLRKKSTFYPFHADLASHMQKIGFLLDDIIIWDRKHEYNNLRPLGYPAVFRINKVHEFILIFRKPPNRL